MSLLDAEPTEDERIIQLDEDSDEERESEASWERHFREYDARMAAEDRAKQEAEEWRRKAAYKPEAALSTPLQLQLAPRPPISTPLVSTPKQKMSYHSSFIADEDEPLTAEQRREFDEILGGMRKGKLRPEHLGGPPTFSSSPSRKPTAVHHPTTKSRRTARGGRDLESEIIDELGRAPPRQRFHRMRTAMDIDDDDAPVNPQFFTRMKKEKEHAAPGWSASPPSWSSTSSSSTSYIPRTTTHQQAQSRGAGRSPSSSSSGARPSRPARPPRPGGGVAPPRPPPRRPRMAQVAEQLLRERTLPWPANTPRGRGRTKFLRRHFMKEPRRGEYIKMGRTIKSLRGGDFVTYIKNPRGRWVSKRKREAALRHFDPDTRRFV